MSYKYTAEEIKKKSKIALGVLLKSDSFLLEESVNERTITHKLAEYLQIQFPDWNVDCEYNRKGIEMKKLEGINECGKHIATNRVFPDIIVHRRNSDENLLVIEFKKIGLDPICDIRKLELFTNAKGDYKYSLGLFVQFDNNTRFCDLKLIWFRDGKEENSESFQVKYLSIRG